MPDRDMDFGTVVLAERARLLSLAFMMLRDAGAVEDAVQNALEICWRSWHTVRDESRRSAWMTTICVRQCLGVRACRLRTAVASLEEWDAAGRFVAP
jgi:DNA-directed RNA polymerase specialized sigma24 family protein